jgi:hypothetical protein
MLLFTNFLQSTDNGITNHFRPMFSILSSFHVLSTDRSAVKLPWHLRATTFNVLAVDSISESKGGTPCLVRWSIPSSGCSSWNNLIPCGQTLYRDLATHPSMSALIEDSMKHRLSHRFSQCLHPLRPFSCRESNTRSISKGKPKLCQILPKRVVQSIQSILPTKLRVFRGTA